MISRFIFLTLLFSNHVFSMHRAIIVFGPSCSGKSTLSKRIARNLGHEWHVIDRDDLIESGLLDSDDLRSFAVYLNEQLKKSSLVIDTNFYNDEFFTALDAGYKLRVLVYAPLARLIERDDLRNQRLQRTPERAHRARLFVKNNYAYFFARHYKHDMGVIEDEKKIYTPYTYDYIAHSINEEYREGSVEEIKKLVFK